MEDSLFSDIENFLKAPKDDKPPVLETEEYDALIESFLRKRQSQDKDTSLDEIMVIVRWAEKARIDTSLLSLVLKGFATVDINDDGEIVFSITNDGREALRNDDVI